jgi:hypothetical protein
MEKSTFSAELAELIDLIDGKGGPPQAFAAVRDDLDEIRTRIEGRCVADVPLIERLIESLFALGLMAQAKDAFPKDDRLAPDLLDRAQSLVDGARLLAAFDATAVASGFIS